MASHHEKETIALISHTQAKTFSPPLGLLCLSTVLERQGYHTEILDLAVARSSSSETAFWEGVRHKKYLWIGITALTPSIPWVGEWVRQIKDINPDVPVLLGGVHASALPERSLRELGVDAVCVGDGEEAVLWFSQWVAQGRRDYWEIVGIAALDERGVFRFNADRYSSHPRPLPVRPNWPKIQLKDYQHLPPQQYVRRKLRVAPIYTTKGCPFRCTFCAVPRFQEVPSSIATR